MQKAHCRSENVSGRRAGSGCACEVVVQLGQQVVVHHGAKGGLLVGDGTVPEHGAHVAPRRHTDVHAAVQPQPVHPPGAQT